MRPVTLKELGGLYWLDAEIETIERIPFLTPPEFRRGVAYNELCELCNERVLYLQDEKANMKAILNEVSDMKERHIITWKYSEKADVFELAELYSYSEKVIERKIKHGLDELRAKGLIV